jgi:hypothetical protein
LTLSALTSSTPRSLLAHGRNSMSTLLCQSIATAWSSLHRDGATLALLASIIPRSQIQSRHYIFDASIPQIAHLPQLAMRIHSLSRALPLDKITPTSTLPSTTFAYVKWPALLSSGITRRSLSLTRSHVDTYSNTPELIFQTPACVGPIDFDTYPTLRNYTPRWPYIPVC